MFLRTLLLNIVQKDRKLQKIEKRMMHDILIKLKKPLIGK